MLPVAVAGARRLSRCVSSTAGALMPPAAIVDAVKRHNLWSWSAAATVNPIVLRGAQGVWLHGASGERWLDLNSGLMCANIGHGHPRVVRAIQEQVRHSLRTPTYRDAARLAELTSPAGTK